MSREVAAASHQRRAREERSVTFIRARKGQSFDLGSGARLEVLSPTGAFFTPVQPGRSKENANSVVMRLTYGRFAMLLTGDAETETEERLIRSGNKLRAQVLKIGHHGSRHATGNTFLRAVRPQAAIISCGAGNNYGHPSPETLTRLRSNGVQTYRTDLHGDITVTTDGRDFKVETARPEGAKGTGGAEGAKGAGGAEDAPTAETVYVTRIGGKYHRDGCQYLRRSRIPISLRDAKRGYTACSVCRPPPQ